MLILHKSTRKSVFWLDISFKKRYAAGQREEAGMSTEPTKRIALVYASDERGTLLMGISIYSLLISRAENTRYVVYILDDHISEASKKKICALQDDFPCEFHFIPIHDLLRQHVRRTSGIWPVTTYGRLFLCSLIPQEDRVIYLDIDTLGLRDLSELYDTDLGEALLGVVFEHPYPSVTERKALLGIPPEYSYFNAGVFVADLAGMRRENMEEQMLRFLNENEEKLRFLDQDVLNTVLHTRLKGVHPRWNWPAHFTRRQVMFGKNRTRWGGHSEEEALEAAYEPAILHFWGHPKPHLFNFDFYRHLYRDIWLRSPWRDVPMGGGRRLRVLIKRLRNLLTDAIVRRRIKRYLAGKSSG